MRLQGFLGAIVLLLSALLLSSARLGEDSIDRLLAQIRIQGDEVEHGVFYDLARIGGEASFRALQKATDFVDEQEVLYAAYGAARIYKDDTSLAAMCIEWLEKDAFKDRREEAQFAATWSLRYFEDRSEVALERIAREHHNATCREFAVMPLLATLGKRRDADSAKLILENASLSYEDQHEGVVAALKLCSHPKTRKLLLARLKDKKASLSWKLAIVEILEEDLEEAVTKAFLKALDAEQEDEALQGRLIDSLGLRRASKAGRTIKSRLESEHDTVRRAAVLAISQILGTDRVWLNKLRTFADGEDAVLRIAAIEALSQLRVEDAPQMLQSALADPDSRVRALVIELLAAVRDKSTVSILIERLDGEHGPLRLRIARVLRLLTGEDFGFKSVRWRAWWTAEGEGFALPTREVTLALEFERRKQKVLDGRTQSTFYGLPVLSENVCFVLDVSGSMNTKFAARGKTESAPNEEEPEGPPRLTVAKQELAMVLEALPLKTYANVVFFEAEAYAWSDELALMTQEARKEALEFIARAEAEGGTDVYEGLARAFDDPRVDTIYLLTDGQPSEGVLTKPGSIRREVQSWNSVRRVQIHCISVGRESEFLRDLARENGGDYRVSM